MNAKNVVRTLRVWTLHVILLLVGAVLLFGCSRSEPVGQSSSSPPVVNAPAPPPPPPLPAAQAPEMVQKKAAVGAGVKGRYESVTVIAPLVTPIASYFCIRERLAYDVQIPQALQLFKAKEDRLPKSHEEFMELIKENHINLPLLPKATATFTIRSAGS